MTGVVYCDGAPAGASAYGVRGDCMAPLLRDGQFVIVEPVLPEKGQLAVFWFKKGGNGPVVKRLISDLSCIFPLHPESEVVGEVLAEQLNPPKTHRVWATDVERIERVHSVVDGPLVHRPT